MPLEWESTNQISDSWLTIRCQGRSKLTIRRLDVPGEMGCRRVVSCCSTMLTRTHTTSSSKALIRAFNLFRVFMTPYQLQVFDGSNSPQLRLESWLALAMPWLFNHLCIYLSGPVTFNV